LSNEQLRECPPPPIPLSSREGTGDRHNGRVSAYPAFVSFLRRQGKSVSPSRFPFVLARGGCRDFRGRRWTAQGRSTRGWEGRANRSRLGLFASYRVGVKINVNFVVELISPAPINSTDSVTSLSLSLSLSLFLALSPKFSLSLFCVSLYLSIFSSVLVPFVPGPPYLAVLHYGYFPVPRFHTALNLPQASWNSKTFAVRKSIAYQRPSARSPEAPFPDSLQESARAFCHDYLRQIVFLLWSSRVDVYSILCFICVKNRSDSLQNI